MIGTGLIRGFDIALAQLGRTPFDTASSYSLSVIPLFILMGIVYIIVEWVEIYITHWIIGLVMCVED